MNLDIEGTKHEKVVIIVLAYVIGFTAGFICFGVAQSMRHTRTDNGMMPVVAEAAPIAPVVADTNNETPTPESVIKPASPAAPKAVALAVTYAGGKLQATVGDAVYLLSMKSSGLDSAVQSAFKNQGLHANIPYFAASPDNKYVYFCEQQAAADSCNSFIFDVGKNVIEYVTIDGKKFTSTASAAKTATWSEKGLSIDGKTSADASAPAALLAS